MKRCIPTKALIILMLVSMATSERKSPLNIPIPCCVKAYGKARRSPPRVFEVPNWRFKLLYSSLVSWNMKSSGNRSMLRFTCLFICFTSTWYAKAKSLSNMTCWPLTVTMSFSISRWLRAVSFFSDCSPLCSTTSLCEEFVPTSICSYSAFFFFAIVLCYNGERKHPMACPTDVFC